jgi:hypothetical protein
VAGFPKHEIKFKPAMCHPDKPAWARGLCKNCYNKWLLANNPAYKAKQQENTDRWHKKHPERVSGHKKKWEKANGKAASRRKVLQQYDLTEADYQRMLTKQGGVCQICLQPPKPGKSLHVDHCHESGRVRGLLCFRCNFGLSWFAESAERMERAVAHLKGTS